MLTASKILLSPLFFFMNWLAEENILFTTVKEGTVKAIMRGKSFDRFIMSFNGYHLNDPTKLKWYRQTVESDEIGKPVPGETQKILPKWEVLYHGEKNKNGFKANNSEEENEQLDDYYDDRPALLKHLGLYWVGWPWENSVYVYAFEWNETYTEKETGKEKVLPRRRPSDFIYVADFTYAIKTDSAETKDGLPTDELTLVTVAIRNPYRALFSGENWMQRITAVINRFVRNFVGSKGYNELISLSQKKEEGSVNLATQWATEFSEPIIALSRLLPDETNESPSPKGLRERYGVEIRTADLQTVEFSGSDETRRTHQEAATRVYSATQTAAATRLVGAAEADVIKQKGDQEALALAARLKVIQEHGEAGIKLAGFDAIQESSKGPGNTIIWANNPLGLLTDIFGEGKKKILAEKLSHGTEKGGKES